MAQTFEMTGTKRAANWMMKRLLGLGVPVRNTYLLTVPGRKSGKPHTIPVTILERNGQRYLVAPYGEVEWVHNVRAAQKVTLSRGREYEVIGVTELGPNEAAPILKQYVYEVPIVRPFFDSAPDSSLAHFEAEASMKPVFRLG